MKKTIKGLVKKLEKMKYLNMEQSESLTSSFGSMTREIFTNESRNVARSTSSRYSEKIKQFAISLHFYSPKVYQFVQKSLHLPNPATMRSWATSVDCERGFLQQVIDHLQLNMKDDKKYCVLLVDEMSIKKEVLWDVK